MISIKKIKKQTIFTILLLKYLKMLTVYLILCKNVHDFVVRTISSDYI